MRAQSLIIYGLCIIINACDWISTIRSGATIAGSIPLKIIGVVLSSMTRSIPLNYDPNVLLINMYHKYTKHHTLITKISGMDAYIVHMMTPNTL